MVTLECRKCGHIHDEDVATKKPENSGRSYVADKKQCPCCFEPDSVVPRETIIKEKLDELKKQASMKKEITA